MGGEPQEPGSDRMNRLQRAWSAGLSEPDLAALIAESGPEEMVNLVRADAMERYSRGKPANLEHYRSVLHDKVAAGTGLARLLIGLELVLADDPDDHAGIHARLGPAFEADIVAARGAQISSVTPGSKEGGVEVGDWIGPYKLINKLGAGGFGIVWVAERRTPIVHRVAIKIIKAGLDTEAFIARFEQERQALAKLDHPGIARIFDAGSTDAGRPYFVMELIRGVPMDRFCKLQKLNVRERLELIAEVCMAVDHAHRHEIVHRDLTPGNILVALVDGKPTPKVIDFGLAKAINAPLTERTLITMNGSVLGTPQYMSPEQAEGVSQNVGVPSDIYALGVILYETLCGVLPVDMAALRDAGSGFARVIRDATPDAPSKRLSEVGGNSVADERATTIGELRNELRSGPDLIAMAAIRPEPRLRYKSAASMAETIHHYLRGDGVTVGREPIVARVQRWSRRHPVVIVITIVAVIIACVVAERLIARATAHGYELAKHQVVQCLLIGETDRARLLLAQMQDAYGTDTLRRTGMVDLDAVISKFGSDQRQLSADATTGATAGVGTPVTTPSTTRSAEPLVWRSARQIGEVRALMSGHALDRLAAVRESLSARDFESLAIAQAAILADLDQWDDADAVLDLLPSRSSGQDEVRLVREVVRVRRSVLKLSDAWRRSDVAEVGAARQALEQSAAAFADIAERSGATRQAWLAQFNLGMAKVAIGKWEDARVPLMKAAESADSTISRAASEWLEWLER